MSKRNFQLESRYILKIVALVFIPTILGSCTDKSANEIPQTTPKTNSELAVDLSADQLKSIKIEPAGTARFAAEKDVVGNVAYNKDIPGADPSTKSIIANVIEDDIALIHVGQPVKVTVSAYTDRIFEGKISELGGSAWDAPGLPSVNPNTRRVVVGGVVSDPKNELYPGMLAYIVIQIQDPVESVAIPANGVVHEGDGTLTAWVTTDRQHFVQKSIKIGLQKDGMDQVVAGLQQGELVVTDGAVFLSNMLQAPPSD